MEIETLIGSDRDGGGGVEAVAADGAAAEPTCVGMK